MYRIYNRFPNILNPPINPVIIEIIITNIATIMFKINKYVINNEIISTVNEIINKIESL